MRTANINTKNYPKARKLFNIGVNQNKGLFISYLIITYNSEFLAIISGLNGITWLSTIGILCCLLMITNMLQSFYYYGKTKHLETTWEAYRGIMYIQSGKLIPSFRNFIGDETRAKIYN